MKMAIGFLITFISPAISDAQEAADNTLKPSEIQECFREIEDHSYGNGQSLNHRKTIFFGLSGEKRVLFSIEENYARTGTVLRYELPEFTVTPEGYGVMLELDPVTGARPQTINYVFGKIRGYDRIYPIKTERIEHPPFKVIEGQHNLHPRTIGVLADMVKERIKTMPGMFRKEYREGTENVSHNQFFRERFVKALLKCSETEYFRSEALAAIQKISPAPKTEEKGELPNSGDGEK